MITVIICTFKRAGSLGQLLRNLELQKFPPSEVLVIDGSPDDETNKMVASLSCSYELKYFSVPPEHRGLTKQRNWGIEKLEKQTDIVSFLDDDVLLDPDYFYVLQETFRERADCIGVSGFDTVGREWEKYDPEKHLGKQWYILDGFAIKLGLRNYLRRLLGLFPKVSPGFIPPYGHGYDAVPPSGRQYEMEHIIGCNMNFKRSVFDSMKFSEYFVGYGLYEDFDFSYRTTRYGKLLMNTRMLLEHHHHPAGRPDTYKYGMMVTRNGWYCWRLKYKSPGFGNILKWYAISLLLAILLLKPFPKKNAVLEFVGRIAGLFSVIFDPPKIEY